MELEWVADRLLDIVCVGYYMNACIMYDRWLRDNGYWNPQYAIHAIHNTFMVCLTAGDVVNTLTDIQHLPNYPLNMGAVKLYISLQLYHVLFYWRTFRIDDWIHIGLMLGVAIPVGVLYPSHSLLGCSLFFASGLPGAIDNAFLFGVRNRWIDGETQTRVQRWIHVWVRSPGCILPFVLSTQSSWIQCLPFAIVFWSGQYFMEKIVADYDGRRDSDD